MKKTLATIITVTPLLFTAQQAFAQTVVGCPTGTFSFLCTLQINQAIGAAISFVFVIVALAALGYLIWGGFKWLTSGGDAKQVEAARNHIIAAIIGLIIVFLSFLIMNIVLGFFHASIFSLTLPSL